MFDTIPKLRDLFRAMGHVEICPSRKYIIGRHGIIISASLFDDKILEEDGLFSSLKLGIMFSPGISEHREVISDISKDLKPLEQWIRTGLIYEDGIEGDMCIFTHNDKLAVFNREELKSMFPEGIPDRVLCPSEAWYLKDLSRTRLVGGLYIVGKYSILDQASNKMPKKLRHAIFHIRNFIFANIGPADPLLPWGDE